MCRFALYIGHPIRASEIVTEPTYSILHQSFHSHERKEPLNGDGFGVAWYVEGEARPALLKEVRPAWNSMNLRRIAAVTHTRCLLAHVRAASPGLPVTQLNCHPFSWDGLTFMHNGAVGGWRHLRQRLVGALSEEAYLGIEGSTDSEHVFALVREAWAAAEAPADPLARLEHALRGGIQRVEALREEAGITEPSLLNLALCDGERAVVSRYASPGAPAENSLHFHAGGKFTCIDGTCAMHSDGEDGHAFIVASEPLTTDATWQTVPENHLVRVSREQGFEVVAW